MIMIEPSGSLGLDDGGVDDVVRDARRSVVAVIVPGRGGSGFVALSNGVVATTHDAVGFELEAELALDDERTCLARVVAVDVAANVAMLLPTQALGLPALRPAPPASSALGARLVMLARPRPGELCVASGIVSGEVPIGDGAWLRTTAELGVGGAAALDLSGRVVGLASAGPRAGRRAADDSELVAPRAAFDALVRAVDLPPGQLAGREPTYHCPACGKAFEVEDDRCLACGARLPHAFELDGPGALAERLIRELLERHGVGANRVRTGARVWRFALRSAGAGAESQMVLRVDRAGRTVVLRTPIARVPSGAAHEALYRLLLTLDDQSTGDLRLSIGPADVIFLSLAVPVTDLGQKNAGERVVRLARDADHYRALLAHAHDVEPLHEADDPAPAA